MPAVGTPLIQVQHVGKEFLDSSAGRTVALSNVSFDIHEHEFFCLLGPSGCGKSTVLNLLAGFEKPTSGRVLLNGNPITAPGPDRAVVFQQPTLYPWASVLRNVNFGPFLRAGRERQEDLVRAREFLVQIGLAGFEGHRPYELSGGMQQRVAIARALINHPKVLLMDEPFGALDAQTRAEMQDFLLHLWQQLRWTVLFITHDVDEAILLGDRLGVMSARPGRITDLITVDIPRPREYVTTTTEQFGAIKRQILGLLHHSRPAGNRS
jgi:NitT/TauT family transport system ATP-binding protein